MLLNVGLHVDEGRGPGQPLTITKENAACIYRMLEQNSKLTASEIHCLIAKRFCFRILFPQAEAEVGCS